MDRMGIGAAGAATTRRMLGAVLAAGLAAWGAGAAAQACNGKNYQYYVDVTNATGYTVYYLYVSHETEKTWGDDLLGSDVLMSGDTQRVWLCNFSSPVFDIKVEDEDGDTYTFYQIDVSRQDESVRPSVYG